MHKHFTNLHVHTDFSLLDGAISLDRLIEFGKKHDFKALAISDHGNVFGAVKFFQKCIKAGIKPILGMEAYFAEDARIKNAANKYYHLILIVQNKVGYKNLCKLIAYSYKEGFYFKPRIDYHILEKHSEGLIVATACLGGHIPKLLMNGEIAKAHERIDWFMNLFGKDRFFLEIHPEHQQEQKILNEKLYQLSTEKGVSLLATGDSHYVLPEDREAHEIMLAIQTQDKLDNPNRFSFGECRAHLRTAQEMLSLFPNHEAAIWKSGDIADSCDFSFTTNTFFFPRIETPPEYTPEDYFTRLCTQGLARLREHGAFSEDEAPLYEQRLNDEVTIIIKTGFVGYFLVVSDFIQWAHSKGIPIVVRGSAAGSVAAWALQFININPIKYNLLFERFLNPERISMPDIDVDICIEGRSAVINYVRDRYGHDNVCHIITFGTMLAKGVIKDVARVLGFPFEDANAITDLIPDQLKITLTEALEQEPRLKALVENNPKAQKLFEIALKLEGLTRHASKHAAGIVISPEPIEQVLPIYIPSNTDVLVAQYAMTELESIGFLKMDLLGLKNLTLIDRVVKLIQKTRNQNVDIEKLPLDDPKTFALIGNGNTSGIFQLETDGFKNVLRKLQPETFEDIVAVIAINRPGPLGSGMVDDFIERKHGRQPISYLFPELEPILQETYGVIVYQEQVMRIASVIASYSLGQADILRKAMGKKKMEVMAEQRTLFLAGAIQNGFPQEKAGELFDLMVYFAGYGFNKSHSVVYAMISYRTAYLKTHYPIEFMACLISLEATNAEKMAFYLREAKEMGIPIIPPNINRSEADFSVDGETILFGLQGIKNIGLTAIETILAQRRAKPFSDVLDLCKRVDLRTCNKRVLEHLIYAGACDELPGTRTQKISELHEIIEKALVYQKDRETGQMGLFGASTAHQPHEPHQFSPCTEWSPQQKLEKEKEVVGFYISAHPLSDYVQHRKWFNLSTLSKALSAASQHQGTTEYIGLVCGLLGSRREIITKKGDRMAFAILEDEEATVEIVLFPRVFKRVESWLDTHRIFVVQGAVDAANPKQGKIRANQMVPLDLVPQEWDGIKQATFELPEQVHEELLCQFQKLLTPGIIPASCLFQEKTKKLQVCMKDKIAINLVILASIERLFIRCLVEL